MIAAFARIEQGSIPAILIFAVVRVVSICFQKISGIAVIAGVIHGDPNDLNDYMETRLKQARSHWVAWGDKCHPWGQQGAIFLPPLRIFLQFSIIVLSL